MHTDLCDRFGIEYPIFAFTPSEHVAAAVSRAGGLGILGAVRFNEPEELEQALTWLDDNTDGKPYGVDVVMPMNIPTEGKSVDLKAMIPEAHISFVERTLQQLGVPPLPEGEGREGVLGWLHSVARAHVDIALKHRPVLIANALGSPPVDVIEQAHEAGVAVAALAGAAKHALSHVEKGVDIIVAQGYEAGGHTGEIASMVLTPEIVDAVGPDVPVLGAGGIGSGRQVAASLALGAQGVWTGSLWLTTEEYANLNTSKGMTEAFLRAEQLRHRADPRLHRQARAAAEDQVDRGLERGGRTRAAADAAAEPPRLRRAQPDERARRPRCHLDAGRADRRPDERGAAGGRRDGRAGPRLRGSCRAPREDPGLTARGIALRVRRSSLVRRQTDPSPMPSALSSRLSTLLVAVRGSASRSRT